MSRSSRQITVLGVLSIVVALWFGLPMTGIPELASPSVRIGSIVLSLGSIAIGAAQRARRRQRAAEALEGSLIGDGEILAERMQAAVAKLKKSGGKTSLYDLPWYVMIGPPGAGKTTALVHSGLKFPGTNDAAVAGFGGTRNCDFWFSDQAVLIDTAGRYTTQDSDAQADKASWAAFLEELKQARPHQPINGVIVSLSCEDIMGATDDTLDAHAQAVRDRLGELHGTLKIDVPVYVLFTKADLISGFRAFFGSYGEARRNAVWGVTFQTKKRADDTWDTVASEFDQLVARLSDELTERMHREPDTASRISIFGFPGQMALMRRNVSEFLRRVFEQRQDTRAILRGFYFTSGTQEGTPIDQVLGAMSGAQGGIQPSFLSGKGRSYFLRDLFERVIFAERHWVGYDNRTLRWRSMFRGAFTGLILVATSAVLITFGYSFWQNATLVRYAAAGAQTYRDVAQPMLLQSVISDPATRPILPVLAAARDIPTGYANPVRQPIVERLGLSRRASFRQAALGAYSEALEQFLRPRMMLQLENSLSQFLAEEDTQAAYRALKVYLLLAKEQDGRGDDLAIQSYFAEAWATEYSTVGLDAAYREINGHLDAMLKLDGRVDPLIKPDSALVKRTREAIADLSPARQVFNAIASEATKLRPFRVTDKLDDIEAEFAFRTADGRPLRSLSVPGLYTQGGYWSYFRDALAGAADIYAAELWVLGPALPGAAPRSLNTIEQDVNTLYQDGFASAWNTMLDRVDVLPEARVPQLAALMNAVDQETRLSGFLDTLESTPEVLLRASDETADQQRNLLRKAAQTLLEQNDGGVEFDPKLRSDAIGIEAAFLPWHRVNDGGTEVIEKLVARVPSMPTALAPLVQAVDAETQNTAAIPLIEAYNAAIQTDVAPMCSQYVTGVFPFAVDSDKHLPIAQFGKIFGHTGVLQRVFDAHLGEHLEKASDGTLLPHPSSVMAFRLTPGVLGPFQRAERIRQLYFTQERDVPSVKFAVLQTRASDGIEGSILRFGSHTNSFSEEANAAKISWPDETGTISIQLQPDIGDVLRFDRPEWAILDFVASGEQEIELSNLDVTHRLGTSTVTYRLQFDGPETPFLMQDFIDFVCPTEIE